jgi:hypothetical protein
LTGVRIELTGALCEQQAGRVSQNNAHQHRRLRWLSVTESFFSNQLWPPIRGIQKSLAQSCRAQAVWRDRRHVIRNRKGWHPKWVQPWNFGKRNRGAVAHRITLPKQPMPFGAAFL